MTPVYPNPKDPHLVAARTVIKERKGAIKPPSYELYQPSTHNYDNSRYTPGVRPITMAGRKA